MTHFRTQRGRGTQGFKVITVGHLSVQLVGQYGMQIYREERQEAWQSCTQSEIDSEFDSKICL
jgi:hypothetical protein